MNYLKFLIISIWFLLVPKTHSFAQNNYNIGYIDDYRTQETHKSSVDDLVLNNINSMLMKYSWWRVPSVFYNTQYCVNSYCGSLCNASYCPTDEKISIPYYEVNRYYSYGDAALAFVICHEVAHHLQKINDSYFNETEADCIGGALMGSLARNNLIQLDNGDFGEMTNLTWSIGTYCGGKGHGTPLERTEAMKRGYTIGTQKEFANSFNQCLSEF